MSITEASWQTWRKPRPIEGGVETPFHHPLVQVMLPGDANPHTMNPLDLPAAADVEQVLWRPMIWAAEGAVHRRRISQVSPDCIVPGNGDYLFHRLDGAFEQVFEGVGLSDTGARNWVHKIQERQEWCAGRGAAYRLLIVPETQTVYFDQAPGAPEPSDNRPVMRVLRLAPPQVREAIVYPVQVLREARARHETFQHDDIHFTVFGGYLCYRALMESLPQCAPERLLPEGDLTWRKLPGIGGFGHALQRERYTAERASMPRVANRSLLKDNRFASGRVDVWETEFPELPSLMIFRTSNSTVLFPFLMRHFSRIVAVAAREMPHDLIESERPEVVVTEFTERHLAPSAAAHYHNPDYAPTGDDLRKFEELSGMPLPLPRGHAVPGDTAAG